MKTGTTIDLSLLEGVWESIGLHPAIVVYHHYSGAYHLMILPMNEYTLQAQPSVYEVCRDEQGYYTGLSVNRRELSYDTLTDTLYLSGFGGYMRN